MTEHIALSTSCNLSCGYCYETNDQLRQDNPVQHDYDLDAVFERLEKWKKQRPNEIPGLHGGEPLLLPFDDLEKILSWVHEEYDGRGTHIQTNGTKIREKHCELFQRYNVSVGISCDGPPTLNKLREVRTPTNEPEEEMKEELTDRMSFATHRAITMCLEYDITPGVIVVLTEENAGTDEKLERLLSWIDNLNQMGVTGHFNPAIPYDTVQTGVSLSPERLKEVYLRAYEWMKEEEHREWNPMKDMKENLLGLKLGNCVNNRCDVFNAGAAKIALGNGESTGCGKTWSAVGDGVPFLQGDSSGNQYNDSDERYEMLMQTPGEVTDDEPDLGGCKGCKFWNVCQGGCPSAGLNDEYRNRTRWCKAKYALYEAIESDLRSLLPQIRLVTDLPWDAEVAEKAQRRELDLKPFANMRYDQTNRPSAYQYADPDAGPVSEIVDDEDRTDRPSGTFREKVEELKSRYGEEVVEVDEENQTIHADSQ